MASDLLQKQWRFARAVPLLIAHANAMGFEVTLGEAFRTDEQAEIHAMGFSGREALASLIERAFPLLAKKIRNNTGNGIRTSLHTLRLALDLQLFNAHEPDPARQWVKDVGPYAQLGAYWKSLAPDHRWGGDFGDTPHFSIEHNGVK